MQHCSAQNIYHLRLPELDAKSFCLSWSVKQAWNTRCVGILWLRNRHLHKFDWLPAWDYVKKCICQVLNNIWIHWNIWEPSLIDYRAFCVKHVIIKFVARPKDWALNCYLQLRRHPFTVISILCHWGPGRQPRHRAQHVPEFSDRQLVNHPEKMLMNCLKRPGW